MPSVRRLKTDVQVLPPVYQSSKGGTPAFLRGSSVLRGGRALDVLAGRLGEEQYIHELVKMLTRQGDPLYRLMGNPRNTHAEARLLQALEAAKAGKQNPLDALRVFLQLNKLSDPATARSMGTTHLRNLPLRSHTYAAPLKGHTGNQYSSVFFRPDPNADVNLRLIANPKTGPMEIVKTAAIPFVDIDTPSTGRFREVHPKAGITAQSKAEALDVLQQLSDKLGITMRAYSSPGGVRAFNISQQATPAEFYQMIIDRGGQNLMHKLDPYYVQSTMRSNMVVPIGSAVRRWDPKTNKYYPFPLDYMYDFSGYPVRTSPKFNRDPFTDYIAAHIGNVTPRSGPARIDPEMLDTVLQIHDARALANRSRLAHTPMLEDLADLAAQPVSSATREFIKKNYKLLLALGLLPAATMTTTNDRSTA